MKRDREAHGWSVREMGTRTNTHIGTLSQVENGRRPMTESLAAKCDEVFPEKRGWYLEEYEQSKSAMPPGLRSWTEVEDKAARLGVWAPSIVHGLLQTPDYARAMIATLPGVTADVVEARLASRMARQQRVLYREYPPVVTCVVDHAALYRLVGSPETMAAQMQHLAELAGRPNVTVQVLPAVAHAAVTSELIIADHSAAYCEHLAAGGVYSAPETVARLDVLFGTILSECYRASESAATIGEAEQIWTSESRATAARTDHAQR